MNANQKSSIKYIETKIQPVYGGKKILLTYQMNTDANGIKNSYIVECELRGVDDGSVYLEPVEISYTDDETNEETLTVEAIEDLFRGKI